MFLGVNSEPDLFLGNANYFWWVVGWSNVWKSVGWNTIIYLAAITSIDPELYESAEIDGAGRFARMFHITLPGIKSTILVLLIMNMGWILNAGFEIQYLLANGMTWETAETIDTFVIRYGIRQRNYSLATALGMFKTVVSIILIGAANQLSKRFAQESLV
jgi:putative aldouronate transport system permease protein